jgi:hypothetical protein
MSRVFVARRSASPQRRREGAAARAARGVNAERFDREIELAAGLQHPHIVPC